MSCLTWGKMKILGSFCPYEQAKVAVHVRHPIAYLRFLQLLYIKRRKLIKTKEEDTEGYEVYTLLTLNALYYLAPQICHNL